MNKKAMEMWQLVMLILAVLLFLFLVVWFGFLNKDIGILLDKLGGLL